MQKGLIDRLNKKPMFDNANKENKNIKIKTVRFKK